MKAPAGFEKANHTEVKKRLIMNIEGREKEGKTSLALSAPAPIALFDLDTGLEGVINKFSGKKEIWVASFNWREATNNMEWASQWENMKKLFMGAVGNKEIRTIVIDTGTEMWELLRLARFGKLANVMPHHYGPVNNEFRDMIRKVYETDKNLILIHKQKGEYVNDKFTGKYVRSGFGDIGYLVQINIHCWRDEENTFGFTIKDCRQDSQLKGEEIMEPMNNFQTLGTMVYPGTEEKDWE